MPEWAPRRARTPSAIALAVSSDTAPCRSRSDGGTSSGSRLGRVCVADDATAEAGRRSPARRVICAAMSPPVQDSATASVRPCSRSRRRRPLRGSRRPRRRRAAEALGESPRRPRRASRRPAQRSPRARRAAGSCRGRRCGSRAPRRPTPRCPSSSSSRLDSPMPNVRSSVARTTGPPPRRAAMRGSTCSRSMRSSSRGTPGMQKKSARPCSSRKPGAVPIGLGSTSAPSGNHACWRCSPTSRARRCGRRPGSSRARRDRAGCARPKACAEHRRGEVVARGTEAARHEHDVAALRRAPERVGHVRGIVADRVWKCVSTSRPSSARRAATCWCRRSRRAAARLRS